MPHRGDARMALGLAGTLAGVGVRHSRAGVARLARRMSHGRPAGMLTTDPDPLGPEVRADPYPWYRSLHETGPVHYSRKRATWIVSGYDEVRAAARAHDQLSSAEGVTRYRARIPMMLTSDRPEHTRLRRLVAHDFTRDSLERRRAAVEGLAGDALDEMLALGEADAVDKLAAPVPVAVIAHVLGVPTADMPHFREWSDRIVEGFGVAPGTGAPGSSLSVLGASIRLHSYLLEHLERCRANPGDDVLSGLLASTDAGTLTDDELFWLALLLLVAGTETTTSLLGAMLLAFAEDPEQYARLRAEPELIPSAVEELLRFYSPIQGMHRTALVDYAIGAATIPAGERVLLLFAAANRDPRHYRNPDVLAIERNPTDHLAFGSGIHFCLGAHLARLEGIVVLQELVARVESIELAGTPEWNGNPNVRALAHLPVRLARRPARPTAST